MRRGCISLGELNCDKCHKPILHGERYLAIEEVKGKESEKGDTFRYCMDCAVDKGYATARQEKDEKVMTVFPQA